MKRTVEKALLEWKQDPKRKILLLRGARQVGKTYSLRELGKTFNNFVEVNFEENPEIKSFFEKSLNPVEILEKLAIYFGTAIVPGESLLFFDEIQASEFMTATGNQKLNSLIAEASPENPLDNVIHEKILAKLKIFQIIGGMPEVVKDYLETKDFNRCQKQLDNLVTSWVDDFAKYKKRLPVLRLQEVFKAIVFQTGSKFKYSSIADGRTEAYKDALELLIKAGLAYKVCHTSARGLPLGAQINDKKFKVLIFDSGIFQRILGLNLSEYIASDLQQLINKGHLAELFAGLELIKSASPYSYPELYYWHREERSSNAEVDFIVQGKSGVVPLEVKSGTKGQMQSLHIFLNERNLAKGIRISAENFSRYDKIINIPLYAASRAYEI
jgi:predicted AAA+ superfamily ATPase